MDQTLLQALGVTKQFPGVVALDSVNFTARRGEVHALMGENGAGKSTLIKVLTGFYARNGGEILLDGQSIRAKTPAQAQQLGISTVYQEVNLVPTLTVAENIYLGREPTFFGKIRWRRLNRLAEQAMSRLNLHIDVTQDLGSYSIAIQQMVAIARALDVQAKLLILDEPTSSLDAGEVQHLFAVMRNLKSLGIGIIFVSHFLDQIYEISDRITVLRNGKVVGEYLTQDLPRVELITRMMGRELANFETDRGLATSVAASSEASIPIIRTRRLGRRNAIEPFDLEIRSGEVLGFAGLLGSGRTETARLLFGIDRADKGELDIDGARATLRSPADAIARGFGFCSEDRKAQGIIPDLTVRENVILALQASKGWLRFFSRRKQTELANHYIKALNIATRDADTPIKNLSGGNQQKVLLARWLALDPRVLILDEPTRGIDVGAKADIQKLILSLCGQGKAVVFISSELEEVVRCSDRVAVLRDRQKVRELVGAEINEHNIMTTIARGEG
ncbi:MAG TPA: sugar ABC transporter ATP-binding protein [Tepidisphaeraceae bacterium]|nr:sugar ABC transporter ATP-binding protein [Tepidisphaeraceae bacterium]